MRADEEMLRVQSQDPAEIERLWKRFMPTAELRHIDDPQPRIDWTSISSEGISLIKYRLEAGVEADYRPMDQLLTCRIDALRGRTQVDGSELGSGEPWATDRYPVRARWEGTATVRAVVFDRPKVEQLAREICGDDTFELAVRNPKPVSIGAERQWSRAFTYLASSFVALSKDRGPSPLRLEALERHALWMVLYGFSTTFDGALERTDARRHAPRSVRQAMSFMDANARETITVDDVSKAVNMSPRGLQHAFQRSGVGITPVEYLRSVRLEGAKRELSAETTSDELDRVAARWGYPAGRRLMAHYFEVYGEAPPGTSFSI